MIKRRVLFVDDEPNIIDGLRRLLRKQRALWDMEFVCSAPEALAKLAAAPFDVVVTDLQMPDLNGAELLERVVQHYPATARIVLSGHAEEEMSRRAMKLAHRFLAKPTDPETLVNAVTEACGARQIVQDERLQALVGACDSLPSAPSLYLEIARAAESETADAAAIGKIISRDMAMCAKLLQLVNSSFFGIARRVSSIEQAVALLGIMRVKAMVLTDHIFREFVPSGDIPELSIDRLWKHSLQVAELSREISKAEKQGGDRPDQAFTAGLLHDIGLLVLACRQSEAVRETCRLAREREVSAVSIEGEIIGATHGDVGGYLLRLWGLPARIVEAVALHHEPGRVNYNGLCAVTVVHAADVLERGTEPDGSARADDLYRPILDEAYLARIGMGHRVAVWAGLADRMRAKQGTADREVVHAGQHA